MASGPILSINLSGMFQRQGQAQFQQDFNKRVVRAIRKGMVKAVPIIKAKIVLDVQSNLKIKRQVILKSFKVKVFSARPNVYPTMQAYSGVPWMGAHDKGARIGGRILIPLSTKRIGYKAWKQFISDLKSAQNLFFDKRGRTTLAWCLNTPRFSKALIPFKKFAKIRSGKGTKNFQRVNIAISKKAVVLRKKIHMTDIVTNSMPLLAQKIEESFV